MNVAENIINAVNILIDSKTSKLQYNKTIRGQIAEVLDASIGQYKIKYQNSYFTAYSMDSNANYQKGSDVYVEILSSDFEKNALIVGTVTRLGTHYLSAIDQINNFNEVGINTVDSENVFNFCSYNGIQEQVIWQENAINQYLAAYLENNSAANRNLLIKQLTNGATVNYNGFKLDKQAVSEYAAAADTIEIGAHLQTHLESEQRVGSGNYGLKVYTMYYDAAYPNKADCELLQKVYIFDINDMTGQPYKYDAGSDQYGIYSIDSENLIGITKIVGFCNNFPVTEAGHENDISISDVKVQFLEVLSEEELTSSSLRITTPYGSYFPQGVDSSITKTLHAVLKIKGKKVNYNSQHVDFYWFKRNLSVFSGDKLFSPYGGNGWECLNTVKTNVDGSALSYTDFIPAGADFVVKQSLCPCEKTTFKCVAVFSDAGVSVSLNSTIIVKNYTKNYDVYLTSSMGTQFNFNSGKTTLTATGFNKVSSVNYTYYWTKSIDGGTPEYVSDNMPITEDHIQVEINDPDSEFVQYECSVFANGSLLGTAAITLLNGSNPYGHTLVIRDGTQLFKYDGYGISPTSNSLAKIDRMVIPVLTFDIYDSYGNLIDISNDEKPRRMAIKWVWPTSTVATKDQTMLTTTETLRLITVPDIANDTTKTQYVVQQQSTFSYGILDRYNAVYANTDISRNNIILEVDFEGEHLVASTNFTFTKEGELGTNGTKYTARIVPVGNTEGYFILGIGTNAQLYSINAGYKGVTRKLAAGAQATIASLFTAQLWNGDNTNVTATNIKWSLASSTTRASGKLSLLTINGSYVKMNSTSGSRALSTILQAAITYRPTGSERELVIYATYAIPCVSATFTYGGNTCYPWLRDGYQEVMYESDGTRGRFNPLPFLTCMITPNGLVDVNYTSANAASGKITSTWNISGSYNYPNEFKVEPPANFIGETVNHYITYNYSTSSALYYPVQLYLNRYGMSAMNDWDGSSIQINNEGGYILSPQVGAGRKETDNTFTGITIGEVFQDQNNKEIGMFGYYHGSRSLFLDAETGDAEFGVSGKGQIKIHASDGEGTIDSGDYVYNHDKDSSGNYIGKGLKIKFTSTGTGNEKGPYIRYGSGNFSVDANGYLTAKGGGNIAGWEIDDENFYSTNGKMYLNSSTPKIYAQTSTSAKHNTLTSTNPGFYLDDTGMSIGSIFRVSSTNDGSLLLGRLTSGNKYWTINANSSGDSYIAYNTNKSVPSITGPTTNIQGTANSVFLGTSGIRLGTKFAVDADGNGLFNNLYANGTGQIAGWKISSTSLTSADDKTYLASSGDIRFNVNNKFYVNADGSFSAANSNFTVDSSGKIMSRSGTIGGFNIAQHKLYATSGNLTLNDEGSIYGPAVGTDYAWKIVPSGRAHFTDIVINNTANQSVENKFTWTNSSGQNIFRLTDSGSQIGGWNISGNQLSSGIVSFNSNGALTGGAVLSVGQAFALYGNGNLSSAGSASFSGNLSASGTGNIGGCTFGGGQFNCPSGVLYFGGQMVTLSNTAFLTSVSPEIHVNIEQPKFTFTPEGTISGSAGGSVSLSCSGSISGSAGEESVTGTFSGVASGYVSLPISASFTGTQQIITADKNFVYSIKDLGGIQYTHLIQAMRTGGDSTSQVPIHWNGGGE